VGPAVILSDGPRLLVVELDPARVAATVPLGPTAPTAATQYRGLAKGQLPPELVSAVRGLPPDTILRSGDPTWTAPLARAIGREVPAASVPELRAARTIAHRTSGREDRAFLLEVARQSLQEALASPEEILISLAREEERVERALGREARAADAFQPVPGTPLADYADDWARARADLARHHEALLARLDRSAQVQVPNLASVVGERVAARLVAAAGGLAPLSRMTASRLQLLGARRRPSADRGPRFGLLFRGARMSDVPVGRRGAYARSLAALAIIAARADATTRADVAPRLIGRRDRRVETLRRRSR